MGSTVVVEYILSRLSGLSSRSLWAQLPHSTRNLPRPGIEPVSLALAGGFLTTGPPGKPPIVDILTSRCLLGTFLAFQWLRFHASTAEGTGSAPDQGSSTHYMVKPKNFLKDAFWFSCPQIPVGDEKLGPQDADKARPPTWRMQDVSGGTPCRRFKLFSKRKWPPWLHYFVCHKVKVINPSSNQNSLYRVCWGLFNYEIWKKKNVLLLLWNNNESVK